ncbi:hypothetical protein PV396_24620 [Streptomyces sp. ME02-8801-2C]|uniref:hypothetical protein n=1 Tax=Streptomyces sp. ME02-8801-2C TaxID=3028680 RepID=UPI00299FCAD0|nr:hypothetical protein [Streptomyces sp. ME02-8801-2C]MDX3455087.1 hypothetical protein [Streptomyces sp. ME02-8801-2C]
MSAVARAALPAAPHPQPHRAAEGAPARAGGAPIKVPLRLVVGAQYPDAALSTYVKIAALALRPEGCTAKVAVIAGYLGTSKSTVERGLRPLIGPDLVDGITEIPTVRRTMSGGTGESAHRVTRPLTAGELWVRIPVRAAEALSPRLLRLYALIAYAVVRGIPVTLTELSEMLYHHSGKKKGQHLSESSARRLVRSLETTGWITVHDREDHQGRHAYEAHRHPLHALPVPAPVVVREPQADEQLALWEGESPVIHDGSGPGDHDGSLATEEDLGTDRRGETKLGGGIRRRRGDRKWVAAPVDNPVPDTFASGDRVLRTDTHTSPSPTVADRAPYTGPGLQLSPRVWRVLVPVHHELAALSPFVLRKIAHALGALLDEGTDEQRLTGRLERRYATTTEIHDIGRWLLGAALIRHGCGNPACETGTIWDTGADCELCATNRRAAAARAQRDAELTARELEMAAQRQARLHAVDDQAVGEPHGVAVVREQLLEPPGAQPALSAPAAQAAPVQAVVPWPARATEAERKTATSLDIRTAIARYGRTGAIHIYGHARVLPHLAALSEDTESRTGYAQ